MVRTLPVFLIVCLFLRQPVQAATLYSRASGLWSSTSVWSYTSGGPSCSCTPTGSDNVIIRHVVLLNKHLTNGSGTLGAVTGTLTIESTGVLSGTFFYDMDVRSGGVLYNCGWLLVRNLSFYNGSSVTVCATANVVVSGNFHNRNNSNDVRIDGMMTVGGSYTNGNGGDISGSGTIVILLGGVTNTGTTFGCTGTNPCSSFPCSITSPCGGTLAVTWESFSVSLQDDSARLRWKTASEEGSQRFVVERSPDGATFRERCFLPATGYSTASREYTAMDGDLEPGWNYYRIREEGVNGKVIYSEVVALFYSRSLPFSVISGTEANSTPGFIAAFESGAEIELELYDPVGVKVNTWREIADPRRGRYPIPAQSLERPGLYVLVARSQGRVYQARFIHLRS